ncbi:MurR/RpiR family transcriptional regulator [Microbacterium esteraromaticum]|uniref:MurR/RpiR family transcriptional regulator n=1 Tax=Microbacterium esteraromaticum TaxID=57043 RepID=UPI001C95C582|nr:MurR/RpiR family transcriptional regulator [Microbacterium esteraromaticum]MBY6060239.1 MurR/RpiR family transcriptional regulator [Microbacterium esteraromaticum]
MDDDVLEKVRRSISGLSTAEAKVAERLLADPAVVMDLAINDLAALCETSISTVARFAQSLGFSGYRELRVAVARSLTLQQAQRERFRLDTTAICEDDGPAQIAAKLAAREISAIETTARTLDVVALDRVAAAVADARRIDLFGQGASSLIAQDLQGKLTRIGCMVSHSADPHTALTAAALRGPSDVVIGFSHTGETAETRQALEAARAAGALTVAVTGVVESSVAAAADVVLLTHAQESSFRGAAMSSRIAQLALVDVLFVRVVQHRGWATVQTVRTTPVEGAQRA